MPQRGTKTSFIRRCQILALLAEADATAIDLRQQMRPMPGMRTVFADLAWLAKRFPTQVRRIHGGDARLVRWHLEGLPPTPLPQPLDALTSDELAALIAARGLLRTPETRNPGWERPQSPYAGDLSAALHGLLDRLGLTAEARAIAPTTLGVSRFGMPTEAPGAVAAFERILRTRQAARFRYRNQQGNEREVHVWPIRLVLIKGEWFCFAWAPLAASAGTSTNTGTGKVKQYALSRITSRSPSVHVDPRLPAGAPTSPPHTEVDAILASGFHATGGGQRTRVVVAVSPAALPLIADRTWGEAQTLAPADDLPSGWQRLAFSSTGLLECRHWVLSFGAAVRVEHPRELREWLQNQAQSILTSLESEPPPITAPHPAAIGATLADNP